MSAADPNQVVGSRHVRTDGRECLCACQWVDGIAGHIVQDADTAKLAELGLMYVEFSTEHHGNVVVCYDRSES